MTSRDLRIAGIITAACLLLSFGASYSYVHGWYATSGVMPLVLVVLLVFVTTVMLEAVRTTAKVRVTPRMINSTGHGAYAREAARNHIRATDFIERLLSPLLWPLLFALEILHLALRRSKRTQSDEMLRTFARAHS